MKGYDLNGNIIKLKRNGRVSSTGYGLMDNLTYTYSGNQVTKIDDAVTFNSYETGFLETAKQAGEYSYDPNGNMSLDKNKRITAITYNYLNLPVQVNKGPTDYMIYTYDATGRKLAQQVYGSRPKTTEYIGEYVYENNVLKFVNHEEGRIVADNSVGAPRPWEYQYFLKDHLGNVRVTFSEKKVSTEYKATLENSTQSSEQNTFKNYSRSGFSLFNRTVGGTYSQLLTAGASSKIGLAKSMAVNPGDVVEMEAYAKYEGAGTLPADATTLFNALVTTFGLSSTGGTGIDGKGAYDAFNTNSLFGGGAYVGRTVPYEDGTAPGAYLNYILFDEAFTLIDFGFDQISVSAKQVGATPIVGHDYLSLNVKVQKKGYLYIYLSNEQPVQTNVYFDDLKITYNTGVEQVADYYPFGLTYNTYTRENSVPNKIKFQGQEHIDDLGLNWDSFKWRNHQPEIGRFFNIDPLSEKYYYNSPYAFSENQVVGHRELEGLEKVPIIIPEEPAARVRREYKNMDDKIVISPVANPVISSEFGPRVVPIAGASNPHPGIDIVKTNQSETDGSEVVAPVNGKITQITSIDGNGAGNRISITANKDGVVHKFFHLQTEGFADGLKVNTDIARGTKIGNIGSTGNSSAPHLHYETRQNGTALNPRTENTELTNAPTTTAARSTPEPTHYVTMPVPTQTAPLLGGFQSVLNF